MLHDAERLIQHYEGEEGTARLKKCFIVYKTIHERGYIAGGHSNVREWGISIGKSKRHLMNLAALGRMASTILESMQELGIKNIEHAKLTLLLPELKERIHDKEKVKELVEETRRLGYRDLKAKYKHTPTQMDYRAVLTKVTRPGKTIEYQHCVYPIDISPQNIWETFGNKEVRVHMYLLEKDEEEK